jgi:MFS transporter, Spinster family, sphingosine-1-phosphate transporter
MASAYSDSAGPATAAPGANRMLALLVFINLFNYIDRQVLSAVLPRLARDGAIISLDDPNAQTKLGLLTSAFMATYMTLSLVFGWLDGRGARRWLLLGFGVGLWSLASGSSGLANGYAMLLATRCLVGVGEAVYGPIASAMISDMYPARNRGMVLAIFNIAIPFGSALGFIIGGGVADYFNDWRHAFWVTYSGLLLALICFFMKDPPRPVAVNAPAKRVSYWESLAELAGIRSYVLCCLGMTAVVFVTGGVAAWVPQYVFERDSKFIVATDVIEKLRTETDSKKQVPADVLDKLAGQTSDAVRSQPEIKAILATHLTATEQASYATILFDAFTTADSPTLASINFTFGGILVVGGILATAIGAWLGERLRTRLRGGYFQVIGFGTLCGLPAYFGILFVPFPYAWIFVFFTIFFLFLYTGPANTILANVCHSRLRATGFAVNILVIHLLGDAISPTIIGFVADQSSLQTAFMLMSVMIVLGGGLWLSGASVLDADTARAAETEQ